MPVAEAWPAGIRCSARPEGPLPETPWEYKVGTP